MTRQRPAARATSAAGVKHLITAASLAAAIAGWTLLAPRDEPPAAVSPASGPAAPAELVLAPPIIPTIVPVASAAQSAPVPVHRPVAAAPAAPAQVAQAPVVAPAQVAQAPVAAPAQVVQAPVVAPAQVAQPALREVTIPAPVTSTRSSR